MANETTTGKVALPGSRRGMKGFVNETTRELRKVNWPSRGETTRLTGVVLLVVSLIAVSLLTMGFVFDKLITYFVQGGS